MEYKSTAYQSLNISGGYRTILPEITYAGHQYDDVLNLFYAKARMYDAENRRFMAVDPVLDAAQYDLQEHATKPIEFVQYLYAFDNPLVFVDPNGEASLAVSWAGTMWPLVAADGPLPIGDIIYVVGFGICVLAVGMTGENAAYYSPSHAWDNTYPVESLPSVQAETMKSENQTIREYASVFGCDDADQTQKGTVGENIYAVSKAKVGAARALMVFASTTAPPPPPNDPNSRGTQTTSKTLYNKNGVRVDVENPGNRQGQIHIQIKGDGAKYLYDVSTQSLKVVGGGKIPNSVAKLLDNPEIIVAIGKGLEILGYYLEG